MNEVLEGILLKQLMMAKDQLMYSRTEVETQRAIGAIEVLNKTLDEFNIVVWGEM